MLNDEEYANIARIRAIAAAVWGDKCVFGEMIVPESYYPEFDWPVRIYGKFDILLGYYCSVLAIGIHTGNGEYALMDKFTDKPYYYGHDECEPDRMLHNFRLLDEVLRGMM